MADSKEKLFSRFHRTVDGEGDRRLERCGF